METKSEADFGFGVGGQRSEVGDQVGEVEKQRRRSD